MAINYETTNNFDIASINYIKEPLNLDNVDQLLNALSTLSDEKIPAIVSLVQQFQNTLSMLFDEGIRIPGWYYLKQMLDKQIAFLHKYHYSSTLVENAITAAHQQPHHSPLPEPLDLNAFFKLYSLFQNATTILPTENRISEASKLARLTNYLKKLSAHHSLDLFTQRFQASMAATSTNLVAPGQFGLLGNTATQPAAPAVLPVNNGWLVFK